jgi:DNA helicase-2/ATP-dependent DNA helicase PcrA
LTAPQRCCALTFTNKAAGEMRTRLSNFGEPVAARVTVGTIHSFCLALLRDHAREAGLDSAFEIASPEEIEFIACQAWPEIAASRRRELLDEVSRLKARILNGEEIPAQTSRYDTALQSRGLIDFDTILQKCYGLLRCHKEILDSVQASFPHIFVDEYQDINEIQHALIVMLVGQTGTITAIGDPHQSIYGFRGADVGFFGSFSSDFPGAQLLSLAENYRTAPTILRAFGQIIAPACNPAAVPLVATVSSQGRLTVHDAPTDTAEAEFVAHEIEKLVGGTSMFSRDSGRVNDESGAAPRYGFSDIAVLYRVNSLRRDLEEAIGRSGIPFTVTGEKPFHARSSLTLLLRFLRFSAGEKVSIEALCALLEWTVTGFTHGMSSILCSSLPVQTRQVDATLVRESLATAPFPPDMVRSIEVVLNVAKETGMQLAACKIPEALSLSATLSPWKEDSAASTEERDAYERLARSARVTGSFREFLDTVLLAREEDGLWGKSEAVSLMTLHAAKGLEWPVVFIIGCEDAIIPLVREPGDTDRAEERRLLYVGMSRAKELLYLTHAKQLFFHGEKRACRVSPFLTDIEASLKSRAHSDFSDRKRLDAEQLSLPL